MSWFLKLKFAANWYDSGKYDAFFTNLRQDFPNYFAYPSHRAFLWNSLQYWYIFPIALSFLTLLYAYQKKWFRLLWVWFFCLGHIFLLHILSPESLYRFYEEVNYYPLIIYVSVPLLFEWVDGMRSKKFIFYLFLIIVTLRLSTIAFHHRAFKERLHWIETQLDKGPDTTNRFFIPKSEAPMDKLFMEWGVAYESLLLSSLTHPDSAKTLIILPDANQYPELFQSDTTFFSGLKKHSLRELNTRYFRLGKEKYEMLE